MTKPVLVYDHNGSNNGTEIFLFYIVFFSLKYYVTATYLNLDRSLSFMST